MQVLILGLSSIVQRRILPALALCGDISAIDIASHSQPMPVAWPKQGAFFSDYQAGLSASDAGLVYVSLPNSLHLQWVLAALEAGKHVIVDKPATLNLSDTRRCLEDADKRSLFLAEATVFSHHPQIAGMRAFFDSYGPLTHLDAHFIIPPLPPQNFRNARAMGGGCLLDMGSYAAAVARLFARSPLQALQAYCAPPSDTLDIDVGFSLLARFEDGLRYSGHFSFEGEYQNRLDLNGTRGALSVERLFSPPSDHVSLWEIRTANKASEQIQTPADVFHCFFSAAIAAIAERRYGSFASDMLSDAQFREALATSLSLGNWKT